MEWAYNVYYKKYGVVSNFETKTLSGNQLNIFPILLAERLSMPYLEVS